MIWDGHIHIDHIQTKEEPRAVKLNENGIEGGTLISLCPNSFNHMPGKNNLTTQERLDNLFKWVECNKSLYPFYWIDPTEEDSLEQVREAFDRGVAGYKIICDHFYPYDERAVQVYEAVAELGKPILFHSGILWDGSFSSIYNRPAGFEVLLGIKGLKFALAHISWPWCDECIAVYGKFQHAREGRFGVTCEMFIDITPGTPEIYRKDALTKLIRTGYKVENNIIFGTDNYIDDYNVKDVAKVVNNDNLIYNDLGVSHEIRDRFFCRNLRRFLGIDDIAGQSGKLLWGYYEGL